MPPQLPPETPICQQVDKLAKNIMQYSPLSDLVNLETLLDSPYNAVKKFRESVFMGEMR